MRGSGPLAFRIGFMALLCGCGGGSPSSGPHAPGSVPQGGACDYTMDCAPVDGGFPACQCGTGSPGSPRCSSYFDVPIGCAGVVCAPDQTCTGNGCMPSAGEGGSCAGTGCLPGLFCNAARVCEAPHAVGGACDINIPLMCASPAFCDATTAICAAPHGVGEACDFLDLHQECISGLSCSAATFTCTAPQLNGAPCAPGDDAACVSGYCPAGHCATRQCHG